MTREQAVKELARLCEATDRTLDNLREHQMQAWVDVLCSVSYERGRAAITHLIKTWTWRNFPPVGAFHKAASDVSFEGQPNAGAYSQDRPSTLYDPDRMRRAIEQQDRWLAMTDEEYLEELERLQAAGAIKVYGG